MLGGRRTPERRCARSVSRSRSSRWLPSPLLSCTPRYGRGRARRPASVAAGPELDISNDPGVQSQVSIAVDPTDERVLLAGSGNWGLKTRAYSSADGGSSWTASPDPPLPAGVPQTCAFGDSAVGINRLGRQVFAFIVGLSCGHIGSAEGTPEPFVAHRSTATAAWTTPAGTGRCPVPRRRAPSRRGRRQAVARSRRLASEPAHQPCLRRLDTLRRRRGHQELSSATPTTALTAGRRPCASTTGRSSTGRSRASPSGRKAVCTSRGTTSRRGRLSIARSTAGGGHFGRTRLVTNERSPRSASCSPPGTAIPARPRRCVTADATVTVDDSSGRYAGRVYVSWADGGRNHGQDVFVAAFDPLASPPGRDAGQSSGAGGSVGQVSAGGGRRLVFGDALGLFLRHGRRPAPRPCGLLVHNLGRRRKTLEPTCRSRVHRLRRSSNPARIGSDTATTRG